MWKHNLTASIGGLEDIGFIGEHNQLLVLSSQGLGVFDCKTGNRLYRSEIDWWPLFDQTSNALTVIPGFYPYPVKLVGLHSQLQLRTNTSDNWQLLASEPAPDEPPFQNYSITKIYLVDADGGRTLIATDGPCEFRAFGFSDTGNVFAVASSCEIIIWSRNH